MKMNEIDWMYVSRFIESMETDYMKWKMDHCAGAGMSWTEFHSPEYENENGKVSFGWSLNHDGAWVNGCFSWPTPFLNPLLKTFWRFRKARKFLKNYLEEKEVKEYREKMKSVI
jgi:hypothetical protein